MELYHSRHLCFRGMEMNDLTQKLVGIPYSLAIATLYFGSWVAMELLVMLAFGIRTNPTELRALVAEIINAAPSSRRRFTRATNRILFALQALAFVAVGIYLIASALKSSTVPTDPAADPDDRRGFIAHLYDDVIEKAMFWFLIPAHWYMTERVFEPMLEGSSNVALSVVVTLLGWFSMLVLVLLPTVLLMLPIVPLMVVVFLSPAWLPFILFDILFTVVFQICRVVERWGLSRLTWARIASLVALGGFALYYFKFWDPTGTSKVAWGEHLG
jgi:hypothetical protein